eukprot:Seg2257.2 transcript_id=Seg2257.2/GoldUCD/mRNA.D3Y31 product="Protein FAM181B" protein_id=Seg2257.2/GoldUCD/D3Y31
MIEDRNKRMSESGSAESLLNFINTASSSVKNVLTRPGCFKRNTNHRRFLQKQLKVTSTRTEPFSRKELAKKPFALSKIKQRNAEKKKNDVTNMAELVGVPRRNATPKNRINDLIKGQFSIKRDVVDAHDLQKELQYLDECKKFSKMVDDLVDNLLESSSNKSNASENEQSVRATPITPGYIRSGSVSSYSSSSEEEINFDFLSGEELVRSLDISELFIPEGHSSPVQEKALGSGQTSPVEESFQIISGHESPVDEQMMYESDFVDVQRMPVFENVFRQFSL